MGKGLSDQQKAILCIAYKNSLGVEETVRVSRLPGLGVCHFKPDHLRVSEILVYYYRWVPRPCLIYRRGCYCNLQDPPFCYLSKRESDCDWHNGRVFDKELCGGIAEYNKTLASVYRAITRLEKRGLLEPNGLNYRITPLGMTIVEPFAQHPIGYITAKLSVI